MIRHGRRGSTGFSFVEGRKQIIVWNMYSVEKRKCKAVSAWEISPSRPVAENSRLLHSACSRIHSVILRAYSTV